ncbi:hypothetical protein M8494_17155 [Serratia ureilytica]
MLIACRSLFNAARDFTRVSRSLNGLLTGDLQIGLVDNLVSLPGNPFSLAINSASAATRTCNYSAHLFAERD